MRELPTEDVPAALARSCAPGEKVVWWDRPLPALFARKEAGAGLLSGVFILAFMTFWVWGAAKGSVTFAIFGLPGVAVGLWLVSAPIRAYRRALGTVFALTDKRAMILLRRVLKSFPLGQIRFVESEIVRDGAGHVYFYEEPAAYLGLGWSYQAPLRKSGFLGTQEPERVAAALLEAAQQGPRPIGIAVPRPSLG